LLRSRRLAAPVGLPGVGRWGSSVRVARAFAAAAAPLLREHAPAGPSCGAEQPCVPPPSLGLRRGSRSPWALTASERRVASRDHEYAEPRPASSSPSRGPDGWREAGARVGRAFQEVPRRDPSQTGRGFFVSGRTRRGSGAGAGHEGRAARPIQHPTSGGMRERRIRIAIPNKGRLSEQTLELFEQAGLKAAFRADRALIASLGEDFQAIFVRAQDVPEYLADGAAELGVTGSDLVRESGRDVRQVLDLGFGRCRLVVAVKDDSPVRASTELPEGTRVATSFPRTASEHFASLGIPIHIAPVSGAAEIAPHLGVADVIVDLTSTGSTLRVNGLREIDTILHSSATLVASPSAMEDEGVRREI